VIEIKPLKCPRCGKRICDISKFLNEDFTISVKCPNCRNIVDIKAIKAYELLRKKAI